MKLVCYFNVYFGYDYGHCMLYGNDVYFFNCIFYITFRNFEFFF